VDPLEVLRVKGAKVVTISLIPPEQREGRRTAVVWVAAVGASLLAAAAALFVAVRWNDIPPVGKLSVIVCVTAVFLVTGETLRKTLPATGNVLFHLGALLIPVDVGALNLRLGLSWQELLLVEGIVCALLFGGLAYIGKSKVLLGASALGVVATAFGIGATTPVPAPVVLAVAALAFSFVRPRSRVAEAWAFAAGLMPILVLALGAGAAMPQALLDLGLGAADEPVFAITTGLLAAFVLGRAAHLRKDIGLAGLAFAALVSNGATAWFSSALPSEADVVGPAAAFVVLQLVALAVVRDAFWGRIGRSIANGAEIFAAIVSAQLVAFVATAPFVEEGFLSAGGSEPNRALGGAFVILALGWVVSMMRHVVQRDDAMLWRLGAIAASVSVIAGVQAGTASAIAIAVVMVIAAAGLVAVRHPLTDASAALALFYAPLVAHDHSLAAVLCGVVGAAVLTAAARLAATSGRTLRPTWLVIVAVSKLAMASAFAGSLIDTRLTPLMFVFGCLIVAAVLDTADRRAAFVARIGSVGVLFTQFVGGTPEDKLLTVVPLFVLLVVDAVRLSDRRIAYAAIAPLQFVVLNIAAASGLGIADTGFVLCVAGVVWAGLSMVVPDEWRRPFEVATGAGLVGGVLLSSVDAVTFGATMFVAGAVVLAGGILHRSVTLAHAGGVAMIIGAWTELGAFHVSELEAYAAPVALHLLVAGLYERSQQRVSSWATYAPAIVILGGSALIERMTGGSGWHAVVAGSVGVLAVVAGGSRRLAGPIVTGTAALAVITIYESLAVAATIPTWAWLAVAGSALVSTAVILERTDTSPIEAGRRVVDVLSTSFE
jgi:hypothetical protein